jgi:hypothetical protein
MRSRFLSLILAPVLALCLTVSASAQTALNETTLAAAVTSSQNFVQVTSATGVVAGGGLYVDREYMTVGSSYTSGTTVPVLRRGTAVSHAASVPVLIGPAIAFGTRDYDGSCVPTAESHMPRVNTANGNIWDCNSAVLKWVNLRDLTVVTCDTGVLVTGMVDHNCFIANRPYLVYRITEVHTTAESAGTLTLLVKKATGTQAPASGTSLTAAAIDMVGAGAVAQTVKTPALTATASVLILATGDRIGLDFTDDVAGELAGVVVTLYLYPL